MQLKNHLLKTFTCIFLLTAAPMTAMAEEEAPSIGLRAGTSLRGEDINQGDIFISQKLPWNWQLLPGWDLESSGELTLHALHNEEENGLSASISTDLNLTSPLPWLNLFAGVGAGAMEDSVLGDYDFGGPIFFLFHAGAGLQLTPQLSLSYRYAHQSNGHIYIKNPSLNVHQLELRYSF